MADLKNVARDKFKQRVVQTVTGIIAIIGVTLWFLGQWWGPYLAAASIILFTVATLRCMDDEAVLKREHFAQLAKK
ncbi:hypothetical protein [Methanocella arvoryzae]|uniref:Uncharacterized protein n=1 Tax=Methanocella arvoryzae (strain DSM 22066 / NBRC 105507 / MRE50) TaxID=351160 RepID=Q0W1I0_METAR|nr:hypothetical protein [Methanocella arvoryzae]CAJ37763.1 hypothetical protein RCIX2722 [Methanocella arvoryzae MRE50]